MPVLDGGHRPAPVSRKGKLVRTVRGQDLQAGCPVEWLGDAEARGVLSPERRSRSEILQPRHSGTITDPTSPCRPRATAGLSEAVSPLRVLLGVSLFVGALVWSRTRAGAVR